MVFRSSLHQWMLAVCLSATASFSFAQSGAPESPDPSESTLSENSDLVPMPDGAQEGHVQQLGPRRFRGFLMQQDKVTIRADLYVIEKYILETPGVRDEIERNGRIRIIVSEANRDRPAYMAELNQRVDELLGRLNLPAKHIHKEYIKFDDTRLSPNALMDNQLEMNPPERGEQTPEQTQSALEWFFGSVKRAARSSVATLVSRLQTTAKVGQHVVTHPINSFMLVGKEAIYLASTFAKSAELPSILDVAQGGAAKTLGLINHVMATNATYAALDAPVQHGVHLVLGAGLMTFHGFFVTTWLNFQDRLHSERGQTYQNVFNFVYGVMWPTIFITNAWSAGVENALPTLTFAVIYVASSAVDAPIAGMGYRGLNRLVSSGALPKWGATAIMLWVKDQIFTFQGTALGLARYTAWLGWFGLNQLTNLTISAVSQLPLQRPVLIIADTDVVQSDVFKENFEYLASPEPIERTAVRKKFDVIHNGLKSMLAKMTGRSRSTRCEDNF